MRLADTNFAGADLRGADLTGVRMVRGDLGGAQVAGSRWNRAALLGVSGLDELIAAPELAVTAVAGRDRVEVMIAPTGRVSSVAFSPDSTLLAVARGRQVELVDLESGQAVRVLSGHTDGVTGVAFSPDGTLLATASADNTVRLWDPGSGTWLATMLDLDAGAYAVLMPDGSYKLACDPGRSLWRVFWWAIKLCRFTPGELDPYDPTIRRLPADAPILR